MVSSVVVEKPLNYIKGLPGVIDEKWVPKKEGKRDYKKWMELKEELRVGDFEY